jgi:transcriptional regulator with XRE-family HTH domain
MKSDSPLKKLRNRLQLTHLEMSELLGMSYSHYSMAEGGNRNLPGSALVRVFEINQLLASRAPSEPETSDSERNFLIEELRSMASVAGRSQKQLYNKVEKESRSTTSGYALGFLLTHFDLLAQSSTNPEQDQVWKEAMKSKTKRVSPQEAKLASIQNRIESQCMALRIRLIQEELEAVQRSS